jgi:hypothetical protein
MSINDYARWLSRVTLAVAIIMVGWGLSVVLSQPVTSWFTVSHDLDGVTADSRFLATAWLLHCHCGVGAGHRGGFALVQHSAFEPAGEHRRFEC